MINCRIVFLNGPMNSGKSTVAKVLAQEIPDSVFLEGEDSVSKSDLSHEQWLVATLMTVSLKACELAHEGKLPIVAFPLREKDWKVITGICNHAGVQPICVTLDPGLQFALANRGTNGEMKDPEKIKKMYEDGYHERVFSSLVLNNSGESSQETARKIQSFLKQSLA